jgi:hypothetical protein
LLGENDGISLREDHDARGDPDSLRVRRGEGQRHERVVDRFVRLHRRRRSARVGHHHVLAHPERVVAEFLCEGREPRERLGPGVVIEAE